MVDCYCPIWDVWVFDQLGAFRPKADIGDNKNHSKSYLSEIGSDLTKTKPWVLLMKGWGLTNDLEFTSEEVELPAMLFFGLGCALVSIIPATVSTLNLESCISLLFWKTIVWSEPRFCRVWWLNPDPIAFCDMALRWVKAVLLRELYSAILVPAGRIGIAGCAQERARFPYFLKWV